MQVLPLLFLIGYNRNWIRYSYYWTGSIHSDIRIGDYLQVDDEVVRVKNTVVPGVGAVTVYRGVLGTKKQQHTILEQ